MSQTPDHGISDRPSTSASSFWPGVATAYAFVPIGAFAVVVDQLTKQWALESLGDGRVVHVAWTLQLNLVTNTGASFSLGSGYGGWLGPVSLITAVLLAAWAPRVDHMPSQVAFGLIIGGALGNVMDRLTRGEGGMFDGGIFDGAVVDFLDLQWWPVFNVADMCVFIGACLLVLVYRSGASPSGNAEAENRSPGDQSGGIGVRVSDGWDTADDLGGLDVRG